MSCIHSATLPPRLNRPSGLGSKLSTGAVTAQVEVTAAPVYDFSSATFAANEGNSTNTVTVVTVTRSANAGVPSASKIAKHR